MAASKKSATRKSSAGKKPSAKKKASARRKSAPKKKSGGPLIDVARKIGTTLGEVNVAVRNRISKLSGGEPSDGQ